MANPITVLGSVLDLDPVERLNGSFVLPIDSCIAITTAGGGGPGGIPQGGPLTLPLNANGDTIFNLPAPAAPSDAATKSYVDAATTGLLPQGGPLTQDLAAGGFKVTGLALPTLSGDAATKGYVDTADALLIPQGGPLTTDLSAATHTITGLATPVNPQDAATKTYVDSAVAPFIPQGGPLLSDLAGGGKKITSLATPTLSGDAATKGYVDTQLGLYILQGGPLTVDLAGGGKKITGLSDPGAAQDAATKNYVDGQVSTGIPQGGPLTVDLAGGSHKITGLHDPTLAQDAATKAYVDSQIGGGTTPTGPAGGALDGNYPNPGIAASVAGAGLSESSDVLSVNVDNSTLEIPVDTLQVKAGGIAGSQIAAAIKDPAAATAGLRTLGTGSAQACAGDDSRLSDSRTPTGSAGGDLTGTYPNPTIAALAVTDAKVATANKDGASGIPSMRTLGTGAAQACAGNDSRLSDSRAPSGSAGGVLSGTYPNPGLAASVAGNGLGLSANVLAVNVDGTTIAITADTLGLVLGTIGGVAWTTLTKPGDTSRASNNVVAADPDLAVALVSGGVYELELFLIYASPAGAGTPDFKFTLAEDATTTRGIYIALATFSTTDVVTATAVQSTATGTTTSCGTQAANRVAYVRAWHVSAGGTLAVQWSQVTSNSSATILRGSSVMRYRRIL